MREASRPGPGPTADPGEALSDRAHRLIPAGAHTYSKGDDQFPANAPRFIKRGQGVDVWGTDDRRYLDWGMGLRSVVLGHAYPRVVAAVRRELENGSNFTRPSPLEADLAEMILQCIPGHDMVKFAKNGSDVTTAAVRLARAFTGRDLVVVCREQPFFSYNDWFIGSTVANAGIPQAIRDLTRSFSYGSLESLEAVFSEYRDQVACVVMEAVTDAEPPPGFLPGVEKLCREHGVVLILDEMITGFRWSLAGAQGLLGIRPDLCTFGKAIGNGFSVAALVGRREIMELGGIRAVGKPRVFLLSATHGGETHALAGALATLTTIREEPVIEHLWRVGGQVTEGLNRLARSHGLEHRITISGYPCSPVPRFLDEHGQSDPGLKTLFMQEMIERSVLFPGYLAPSYSHTEAHVQSTLEAADAAMAICHRAVKEGSLGSFLRGPPVKPVFRATI